MRLLVLALAVGCGGPPALQWSKRADMPVARMEHALLASGGKLYAIGGFSKTTLAEVDEYDPAADRWVRKADMHDARRSFVAGAIGGKLYAACGSNWSTDPNRVSYSRTTERYDPVTDQWTLGAACPVVPYNSILGNLSIGGAAVGGKIVLVAWGGQPDDATWSYDPAADRWTAKAAPPFSRVRWAGAEAGGRLYALGSGNTFARFGDDAARSLLASYDADADRWRVLPDLPGVWNPALASVNGTLFAFGGQLGDFFGAVVALPTVMQFDTTSGWQSRGELQAARYAGAAAALDGVLYVSGGSPAREDDFAPAAPVASVESAPAQ